MPPAFDAAMVPLPLVTVAMPPTEMAWPSEPVD